MTATVHSCSTINCEFTINPSCEKQRSNLLILLLKQALVPDQLPKGRHPVVIMKPQREL